MMRDLHNRRKEMHISAIICTRNRSGDLENCIDSIKELLCDLEHLKFPVRILFPVSSFFITTQQKSGVAK